MTAFLDEWDMTVTDKLDQVTFGVMACLTVKMVQITEIYPCFHMLHSEKAMHPL